MSWKEAILLTKLHISHCISMGSLANFDHVKAAVVLHTDNVEYWREKQQACMEKVLVNLTMRALAGPREFVSGLYSCRAMDVALADLTDLRNPWKPHPQQAGSKSPAFSSNCHPNSPRLSLYSMHFHILPASKEGDASMVTGKLHTQEKCPTKPSTKCVLLFDHVPNFNTHFPLFAC